MGVSTSQLGTDTRAPPPGPATPVAMCTSQCSALCFLTCKTGVGRTSPLLLRGFTVRVAAPGSPRRQVQRRRL